jgi:hypothetical protein
MWAIIGALTLAGPLGIFLLRGWLAGATERPKPAPSEPEEPVAA